MKKLLATTASLALLSTGVAVAPSAVAFEAQKTEDTCVLVADAQYVAEMRAAQQKFIDMVAEDYEAIAPGADEFITNFLNSVIGTEGYAFGAEDALVLLRAAGNDVESLNTLISEIPFLGPLLQDSTGLGTAGKLIGIIGGALDAFAPSVKVSAKDLVTLVGIVNEANRPISGSLTSKAYYTLDEETGTVTVENAKGVPSLDREAREKVAVGAYNSDLRDGLKDAFATSGIYAFMDDHEKAKQECIAYLESLEAEPTTEPEATEPEATPTEETEPSTEPTTPVVEPTKETTTPKATETPKETTKNPEPTKPTGPTAEPTEDKDDKKPEAETKEEGSSESTGVIIGVIAAIAVLIGAVAAAFPYIQKML